MGDSGMDGGARASEALSPLVPRCPSPNFGLPITHKRCSKGECDQEGTAAKKEEESDECRMGAAGDG